jgi:iron complex outermembrane receptor protein
LLGSSRDSRFINDIGGINAMTLSTPQSAAINRTVLASTISALMAGGGMAQAQQQQQSSAGLEEITVTGSRIVRRDLDAASPIVTIDSQRLENSSTLSIESVLNQMPQFVPENTQFDSGIQTGATLSLGIASVNLRGIGPNRTLVLVDGRRPQPVNAALVIDLNTIPAAAIERVETITGGASAVYGADALAGVVNFILKDDFEGVEMDLQTGTTQEGDGGETRFTTLMGVNSADGGANVMFGAEWYKRDEVLQRDRDFYTEGWFDPQSDAGGFIQMAGFSPGTIQPTQAAVDALFIASGAPGYTPGRVPNTGEIYFNPDGSPFALAGAYNYRGPFNSTNIGDGFSGVRLQPNGNLGQVFYEGIASTPLERRSVFGKAKTDLGENVTAFLQANYANTEVETRGGYPPAITIWQAPIPNDSNRTLPTGLQALLNSRMTPDPDGTGPLTQGAPGSAATSPWNLFRVLDFLGGPVRPVTTTDTYQLLAGFEGSFADRDWTWEAYFSTGETEAINTNNNLPSLQRYQSLVARPNFGVGVFPAAGFYSASCATGLPIFRTTDPSADCLEAIETKAKSLTNLRQNVVEANLQGKIADLKAGELRFAAGVSTRENKFAYDPINDNSFTIENPIGLFASNNTAGSTKVNELYGELLLPATERLNVELGYRYSDYDTATGSVDTWKTLFDWSPTDTLRLRGGYQVATRAPNTAELFQGQSLLVVGFAPSDPCSFTTTAPWGNGDGVAQGTTLNPRRAEIQNLCRAIIFQGAQTFTSAFDTNALGPNGFARPGNPFFPLEIELQRGNVNVGPEEATTWTLGLVFTPGNGNLTGSVDLYNIEIENAIAPLNSLFVYSKCFNADGVSNPTLTYNDPGGYCRLIGRNTTSGERATVDSPFSNAGVLETTGLDIAVNWTKDAGEGSLFVNSLVTFVNRFDVQDAPTEPVIDLKDTFAGFGFAGGGQFDYKITSTVGYNFGGGRANVGLQWRYLPSIRDESAARNPATNVSDIDSYQSFNLYAGYSFSERFQLRAGIDNLLDEDPLIVGSRPGDRNAEVTRSDYYDILGRRAYVGLKMSF